MTFPYVQLLDSRRIASIGQSLHHFRSDLSSANLLVVTVFLQGCTPLEANNERYSIAAMINLGIYVVIRAGAPYPTTDELLSF